MLIRNHQADHPAGHFGARAASLPAPQERQLRGIAEARAASDLAHRLIEAERARDDTSSAEDEGAARRAASHADPRGGGWVPVVIGIVLGALLLFAAGALAPQLGLWG